MTTNKKLDERISQWLEAEAPRQLPDRVLNETFERTRRSTQLRGFRWLSRRLRLSEFALMATSAAVIVIAAALGAGVLVNRPGVGGDGSPVLPATTPTTAPTPVPTPVPTAGPTATPDPGQPFVGVWVSTSEPDGGTQTLTVTANPDDGHLTVVVLDTVASVCSGASSTMTGQAAIDGNNLVIAEPDYTCDDGSEPHLLNGDPTPLNEILRNLTYVLNSELDILTVGDNVWSRQPADGASPEPPGSVRDLFIGSWEATDNPPDSSHLVMEVAARVDGGFDIEMHDDSAAVCQGTPSTMTGVAFETEPATFVIERPDYRCDDGSEAHELSGPPLAEQLRNYTFRYDPATDRLREPSGVVWSRSALANGGD